MKSTLGMTEIKGKNRKYKSKVKSDVSYNVKCLNHYVEMH